MRWLHKPRLISGSKIAHDLHIFQVSWLLSACYSSFEIEQVAAMPPCVNRIHLSTHNLFTSVVSLVDLLRILLCALYSHVHGMKPQSLEANRIEVAVSCCGSTSFFHLSMNTYWIW